MSAIVKFPSYVARNGRLAVTSYATEPGDAFFVFDIVYPCSCLCQHLDAGVTGAQRVKLFSGRVGGGLFSEGKVIKRVGVTVMVIST